jgi:TPR repeat protein
MKFPSKFLSAFIFSLTLVFNPLSFAYAGYDEGSSAYDKGNFPLAFKEFKILAEQGLKEAQFKLGVMYWHGQFVDLNYSKSFHWYKKAADQGLKEAQFNLGNMYFKGLIVDQNWFKAFHLYKKAAEQGLNEAQFNLGSMYFHGQFVDQDYFKAFQWFTKAAKQGVPQAQNHLGAMYEEGLGTNTLPSLSKAKEWYGKACENNSEEGCLNYARFNR